MKMQKEKMEIEKYDRILKIAHIMKGYHNTASGRKNNSGNVFRCIFAV